MPSQTSHLEEIAAAIRSSGLEAELNPRGLSVDGHQLELEIVERSHPTPADLKRLSIRAEPDSGRRLFVIADRISETGRDVLRAADVSWLDRRGHLRLWVTGLRLEIPFKPVERIRPRTATTFTPAVCDVVFSLLQEPATKPSPRRLGGLLERSPGYVSTILSSLAGDGLLDNDGHALLPELFWALVDTWPRDWVLLADDPNEVRQISSGVVSGVHAAAFWGAPVLVSETETVQLYVADKRGMRQVLEHSTLAARRSRARVAVRELGQSSRLASLVIDGETVAHPLLCALDLGVDQRSRETLEGWRATNSAAGSLALIEVLQSTVSYPQADWVRPFLRRELSVEVAESLAAWCWSDPECLALVLQNANVPHSVRETLRPQVERLSRVNDRSLAAIVTSAPDLLAERSYQNRYLHPVTRPSHGNLDWSVEWDITEAYFSNRREVSQSIEQWAEKLVSTDPAAIGTEVTGPRNPWLKSRAAAYLLRWPEHRDLSVGLIERLRNVELATETISGLAFYSADWMQGSDGSNPQWRVLGEKIAAMGSLSPTAADRLLREALDLPLVDQAVPLCELLRLATVKQVPKLLGLVTAAAQAVLDLHLRARVLAFASTFAASIAQRDELLNSAMIVARAGVHDTSSSLLGGPEPGGVSGLLHVIAYLDGAARRTALAETVQLWSEWVDPEAQANQLSPRRTRGERHMLFSGGAWDPTEPLIRWLLEENFTDDLRAVFATIRKVQREPSNALEVMLAHTASLGLLKGDLEVCALFVSEARRPSPSEIHRHEARQNEKVPGCPFEVQRFPEALMGFRNAWR